MAIKKLDMQLDRLNAAMSVAMMNPTSESVGRANQEFKKLKFMLDGLTSFVEHRWQVKLFGVTWHSEPIDIVAEHLEEAREKAIDLADGIDTVIKYELYCDGKLIPEE